MMRFSNKLRTLNIRVRVASLAVAALLFLILEYLAFVFTGSPVISACIVVFVAIIGVIYTKAISLSILNEIKMFREIMEEVAAGNMSIKVSQEMITKDEFGTFALSVNKTLAQLHTYQDYIDEIARVLADISSGKMKINLQQNYDGQFSIIKDALLKISSSLNQTLTDINSSSDLVAVESENMQIAATKLSDATSDQASTIEELNASIQEITSQVAYNANNALEAKQKMEKMGKAVLENNNKERELLLAMEDINKTSNDIVNIIQTIEGIANQTNLLSLNASIEAARAGEMGRGFAVVASEIGSLANQSVNAVKMTSELVQRTLDAVHKGVELADASAKSTEEVQEVTNEVKQIMDMISDNSQTQSTLLNQFSNAVEQITETLNHNQTTAIESANISESLKKQAFTLKEQVEQFELY